MKPNTLIPNLVGAALLTILAPLPVSAQDFLPEVAQTITLNRDVAGQNADADRAYQAELQQYQSEKSGSDAAQADYRTQLTGFEQKNSQNTQAHKEYDDQLKAYNDALAEQKNRNTSVRAIPH